MGAAKPARARERSRGTVFVVESPTAGVRLGHDGPMLSRAELDQFVEQGFVHLRSAFPRVSQTRFVTSPPRVAAHRRARPDELAGAGGFADW